MGQEAIKLELINWLSKLTDEETIQNLKIVKDSVDSPETDDDDLIKGLNRAASDIDNGRISDHDEIARKYGL